MTDLLTRGQSSPKLAKEGKDFESAILHLASGRRVCPWATDSCLDVCLTHAGRGAMTSVQAARQRRTDLFFEDRRGFLARLDAELTRLEKRAARRGVRGVVRLNGTSDLAWETFRFYLPQEEYYGFAPRTLFQRHPAITFYDYTKSSARAVAADRRSVWPRNYSLTLSRTERWAPYTTAWHASNGVNVAVVFDTPKGQPLPETFEGVPVIDGRLNDWRFNDPRGVVVGLSALGKARKDTTGFVVRTGGE